MIVTIYIVEDLRVQYLMNHSNSTVQQKLIVFGKTNARRVSTVYKTLTRSLERDKGKNFFFFLSLSLQSKRKEKQSKAITQGSNGEKREIE